MLHLEGGIVPSSEGAIQPSNDNMLLSEGGIFTLLGRHDVSGGRQHFQRAASCFRRAGEEGILPQRAAGYSRGRHDEFRGRYYAF